MQDKSLKGGTCGKRIIGLFYCYEVSDTKKFFNKITFDNQQN
jgi:hypothetical protein